MATKLAFIFAIRKLGLFCIINSAGALVLAKVLAGGSPRLIDRVRGPGDFCALRRFARICNSVTMISISEKGVPLSRVDLRKWSEKRAFFGGNKFVNTYMERDKKILKKKIFALTPLRIWLIFSYLVASCS